MNTLEKTLLTLKENNTMNFCEDFAFIRSILNSFNENIRALAKIQFRGGNELFIHDLELKLRRFLKSKNYLTTDNKPNPEFDIELRKITFYLILNTEVTIKYDLKDDHSICHLVKSIPQLPPFLLLCCIWDLNLEQYLYECITYSPIWFSHQFINKTVECINNIEPVGILIRIDHLITSIYTSIARSDYRIAGNDDQKVILQHCCDYTMDFLRNYFTLNPDQYTSTVNKYKYSLFKGHVIRFLFNIILKCFEIYRNKPKFQIDKNYEIYLLMNDKQNLFDNQSSIYNDVINENLLKINTILLNTLQINVMQVEISTFLNWVETDITEEQTLQRCVGESAYKLMELIEINECFQHDVAKQLKNISIKPLTLEEIAKKATLGVLMNKLDSFGPENETRYVWINEFISRGIFVFENDECMETLEQNIEYLTIENIQEIIKFILLFDEKENVEDIVRAIIIDALNNFSKLEINKLILYSLDHGSNSSDLFEMFDFDSALIEMLNKLTNSIYTTEVLKIVIQNPNKFYDKMFEQSLKNEQQLSGFIDFIKSTPEISKRYLENKLYCLFENKFNALPQIEVNIIPTFIFQLYQTNLIGCDEFIINNLYKLLVQSLKDRNYTKLLVLMKSFLLIACKNEFGNLNAPVLVMAGQVLDHCRWDMVRYTEELENVVMKSIDFIQEIMRKFLPIASEKDKLWILSKIESFKPMTKYYYHKLQLSKEEAPTHFDEFLHKKSFQNETNTEITVFLCEVFVRCTKKESSWLAKNPYLVEYFTDVILMLSAVVSKSTISNSINCFRHCVQCYINIVKNNLLPLKETNPDKILLFKTLVHLLSSFKDIQIYDELFLNIHFVLLDIAEKALPDILGMKDEFKSSIGDLRNCEAKTLFLQKYELIVSEGSV